MILMEVELNNNRQVISFSGTAIDLLKKLNVRREEVVIKVNGKLAPETTPLKDTDKVEIIQVVFGG